MPMCMRYSPLVRMLCVKQHNHPATATAPHLTRTIATTTKQQQAGGRASGKRGLGSYFHVAIMQ